MLSHLFYFITTSKLFGLAPYKLCPDNTIILSKLSVFLSVVVLVLSYFGPITVWIYYEDKSDNWKIDFNKVIDIVNLARIISYSIFVLTSYVNTMLNYKHRLEVIRLLQSLHDSYVLPPARSRRLKISYTIQIILVFILLTFSCANFGTAAFIKQDGNFTWQKLIFTSGGVFHFFGPFTLESQFIQFVHTINCFVQTLNDEVEDLLSTEKNRKVTKPGILSTSK